ncbi:MFS transporter [Aurantimonas sp. Leaf443]|uniref:MFS transporter n=1 Tax=Aurantimonas sp. Leaf443 TaxID=1736378 RepID=UPI0006F3E62D|nr:MFS transporter [Aurantimonas sp. Leaf443]KQT87141.1 arabinose ABC transporter permease [Aurantimonas sp. Leaf443]
MVANTDTQGLPSSRGIEEDARKAVSDGHVRPAEIAIGVVIGRASEAFDFFVYGIASILVFPALVFPFLDPLQGTLVCFAIFGLAFVVRPIGSILFMEVDRRHGRGVKLTIALFLLGGSTAAIAFLPGYETIGHWSIAALVLFRMGQGVALGGAWDGLASLLALNVPEKKRGWYAMLPQLGGPIGFIVASALFAFFVLNLTPEDFLGWGWRYPFFVAFTINVVALFARLRLIATEEFVQLYESRDLKPVKVMELLREQGSAILLGAFVPLAGFALFHLVTIFPLSYVNLYTDRLPGEFLVTQIGGAALFLVCTILSGVVADRIGRRVLLGIGAVAIAVFAIAIPFVLGSGRSEGQTAFVYIGFALLGFSHGQAAGATASNFSSQNRYTGSALTSDLAWLIGAGFAPFVALGLTALFGVGAIAFYLLSGAACTLAALAYNKRKGLKDTGAS